MVSANTTDSKSVVVDYTIENAPIDQSITFGVYRSTDSQADATAVPVGTVTVFGPASGHATLDQAGQSATALGTHQVVLPLPGGLPPDPSRPYVVVEADPNHALGVSSAADDSAAFRTYLIGVITHGGVQPMSWKVAGPPWEQRMARQLRQEGYDAVIPYNWVAASNHAGEAARQGPRLAKRVIANAGEFPANSPVDVQFIGHSEGTVVNGLALQYLQENPDPQLNAGYLVDTLLDPHSANNGIIGQQYSVSGGLLGQIARMEIDHFQSAAKDPAVIVPSNVDRAEVFYEHTPVSQTHSSNGGLYNLWGQVPVHGSAVYFNLTAPGISHAGTFGVQDWYRLNVVPTLANGDGFITSNDLTVSPAPTAVAGTDRQAEISATSTPTYTGTAAPGSTVRMIAARTDSSTLVPIGQTVTAADGNWTLTTNPLGAGVYRLKVIASPVTPPGRRPVHMTPTAWPKPLIVNRGDSGHAIDSSLIHTTLI